MLFSDGPNTCYEDSNSNTICYKPIDRYKESRAYIVSYGPTKALKDIAFWKKIWELQCEIIVMITTVHDSEVLKIKENKMRKVLQLDKYLTIILLEEEKSRDNYKKLPVTMQMNQAKSLDERNVTLFEFFAWQNVGIPDDVKSFLEFHKKVVGCKTNLNGPTLVHCSAGLHRCATYVAFDMLQSTKRSLSRNDIQLCLEHLKKHGPETTLEKMDHLSQMLEMSRNSHN